MYTSLRRKVKRFEGCVLLLGCLAVKIIFDFLCVFEREKRFGILLIDDLSKFENLCGESRILIQKKF